MKKPVADVGRKWAGVFAAALFILLYLINPVHAQKSEPGKIFLDGVEYFQQGDYDKAVSAFLQITRTGVKNGKLFYNLGNAYLKSGDVGNAMLWYERALKLLPDDPDLKFNLNYARSFVKDQREDKRSPILAVLFFWRDMFGIPMIQWIAIISNVVFWIIFAIGFIPGRIFRRGTVLKSIRYVSLAIAIVFTATAIYNFHADRNIRYGIIIPDKVSVRSGLNEDSTELFLLHAGTKVRIERQNNDHYRIFFSDDKIGWLKKSEAAII